MIKYLSLTSWTNEFIPTLAPTGEKFIELGKLNIFIGRNNSGKSRFIRSIYRATNDEIECQLDNENITQLKKELELLSKYIPEGSSINGIDGNWIYMMQKKEFLINTTDRKNIKQLKNQSQLMANGNFNNSQNVQFKELQKFLNNYPESGKIFDDTVESISPVVSPNKIYLPILRGMRPLGSGTNHFYAERTNTDYFHTQNIEGFIATGEELYETLKQYLLGYPEQREKIRQYEKLLSENFFEGKSINLIPKHDHDVVNVLIDGESQLRIYELGDGLQQIIIITAAAYLEEKESLILIEEPEISLHPGLLRQLMKFLLENTPHQYFVTTHSNHMLELADERSDCCLYKISKNIIESKPVFEIIRTNKDRSLLIDLGVKSSSIYLANCTIWVEGITDRLYLREYLKKYINSLESTENVKFKKYSNYIENYNYAFVEYQGGNLVHWSFEEQNDDAIAELSALSVTTNAFLIADGDIASKGNRVEKLKEQLNDKFYIIKGKEIENLIPDIILKKVAIGLFEKFTRKKHGADVELVKRLSYSNYVNSPEGLGFHLDKAMGLKGKGKKSEPTVFASESGTLKDKMEFCALSTKYMNENEWEVTQEISDLCEKILSHIEKFN